MSRPLGATERFMYYRDTFGCYTNVVTIGKYELELTSGRVYSALKGVLQRETGFRTNTREGNQLRVLDRIKFADCVEFRTVDVFDIQSEISHLHDIAFPLDSDIPLWKLIVFNNHWAAFVSDHVICDGIAMANFHVLFGEELNKGGSEDRKVFAFEEGKLDPPMEEFLTLKVPEGYKAKRRELKRLTGTLLPLKEGYPSVHTKIAMLAVDSQTLKDLRETGKNHGVRLTSILMYFATRAMQNVLLSEEEREKEYDLRVRIPINGRKDSFDAKAGCFLCSMEILVPSKPLSGDIDWAYANAVQDQLDESMAAKEPLYAVKLQENADIAGNMAKMKGIKSFTGLHIGVSNLGYYPLGVQDFWFSQCSGYLGAYVTLNVIGFEEGLRVTFSYDTSMPYAGKMDEMAQEVGRLVRCVGVN